MYIYTITVAPLYICIIINKLMCEFFMLYCVNFITFLYFRSIDAVALTYSNARLWKKIGYFRHQMANYPGLAVLIYK